MEGCSCGEGRIFVGFAGMHVSRPLPLKIHIAFLEGARGNRSLAAKERFPRNIYLKFPRFQAGFRALFSEIYKEWKFSLGEAGI